MKLITPPITYPAAPKSAPKIIGIATKTKNPIVKMVRHITAINQLLFNTFSDLVSFIILVGLVGIEPTFQG